MTLHGSCLCGAVEFTIDEASRDGAVCHCLNCRNITSGASYNLSTRPNNIQITRGKPSVYKDTASDSGSPVERSFCRDCGSALWAQPTNEQMKNTTFVKIGSLKEASEFKVTKELYAQNALPGLKVLGA